MQGLPNLKINCLLPGPNGDLWIGTDKGIARWTGTEVTQSGLPAALHTLGALAMIRDRESNVWIAAGSSGLLRVNGRGVVRLEERDPRLGGAVTALFEDRDSNIWIGTTRGIERLRDGVFTSYTAAQGLPSDSVGPVHVDSAQRIWFAPVSGRALLDARRAGPAQSIRQDCATTWSIRLPALATTCGSAGNVAD